MSLWLEALQVGDLQAAVAKSTIFLLGSEACWKQNWLHKTTQIKASIYQPPNKSVHVLGSFYEATSGFEKLLSTKKFVGTATTALNPSVSKGFQKHNQGLTKDCEIKLIFKGSQAE